MSKITGTRWKELRTYTSALFLISGVWFSVGLFQVGILKMVYQLTIVVGIAAVGCLLAYLLFSKKRKKVARAIGNGLAILLSICLCVGAFGFNIADSLIQNVTKNTMQQKDISIIVLNESKLQEIQDIDEEDVIGIQKVIFAESVDRMLEEVEAETEIAPQTHEFANLNEMVSGLYDGQIPMIILDEAYREVVELEWETFRSDTRILYSINYAQQQNNISKKINVCEDAFVVLISGIDTYGEINTVSRSDVNILAVVNPKQAKILLVSIPRDYYVPIISGTMSIAGADGSMDKLTHSGLFGAECTVHTLENFFDISINYYVRVNFSSVEEIVDALGGITVVSDVAFGEFEAGENQCNGEQALAFARNRKSFEEGDRQRGKNQMKVIDAIVKKSTNPSLNYDYMKIFDMIKDGFEMNFSDEEVKAFLQFQVSNMPSWVVESISVNGSDGHDYSYFYGSELYVMYPDENSVAQAREKILQYLEEVQP